MAKEYRKEGVLTVGELRKMLKGIPADAEVVIGLADDSYNRDGGLFVPALADSVLTDAPAYELRVDTPISQKRGATHVQLMNWYDFPYSENGDELTDEARGWD